MAITSYNDFVDNYLTKHGMLGSAENLNRAPNQLKLELDELNLELDELNLELDELNQTIGTLDNTLALKADKDVTYTKTQIDTNFQVKLSSGTNIKTINGNDLTGAGDISLGKKMFFEKSLFGGL